VRGYGFQVAGASRPDTGTTANRAGIGAKVKSEARKPAPWRIGVEMFGEMLPYRDNQASLDLTRTDKWGIPLLHMDAYGRDNERRMIRQAAKDAKKILEAGGFGRLKQ